MVDHVANGRADVEADLQQILYAVVLDDVLRFVVLDRVAVRQAGVQTNLIFAFCVLGKLKETN